MIEINKFKDEISGKCFNTKEEAVEAENKHRDIQDTFSFYNDPSVEGSCDFENGEYCIQRDKGFYDKLINGIIKMVNKHENWILKSYKKVGGLSEKYVSGYTLLGRFLDDTHSPLYRWWSVQARICPTCFREYGQMYYTQRCTHDDTIPVN